jgi:hypothetical protein
MTLEIFIIYLWCTIGLLLFTPIAFALFIKIIIIWKKRQIMREFNLIMREFNLTEEEFERQVALARKTK